MVTMREIAKLAGVSTAVVSSVINNKKGNIGVSEEKRKQIIKLVQELNYTPNPIAKMLYGLKTNLISVIMTTNTPEFIDSVKKSALINDYKVLVSITGYGDQNFETETLKMSSQYRPMGIIWRPQYNQKNKYTKILETLKNIDTTIVTIETNFANSNLISSVLPDYKSAIEELFNHILDQGYQAVMYLIPYEPLKFDTEIRKKEFKEISQKYKDIKSSIIEIPQTGINEQEWKKIKPLIKPPSVIYCDNDIYSAQIVKFAQYENIKIPEELGIVSRGDYLIEGYFRFGEIFNPPLTVIRRPFGKMGEEAFKIIADKNNSVKKPVLRYIQAPFIVRDSTLRRR